MNNRMQIALASGKRVKLDVIDYTPGSDLAIKCSKEIYDMLKSEKFKITRFIMGRLKGSWELTGKDVYPNGVVFNFDRVHDRRPWQINDFQNREVPNEELEWDDGDETVAE